VAAASRTLKGILPLFEFSPKNLTSYGFAWANPIGYYDDDGRSAFGNLAPDLLNGAAWGFGKVLDTVSIFVARSARLPTGSLRWKIGRKIGRCSNLVVVARMKETNESILDYYLLPHSEIPERRIEFQDWPRFDAFRIEIGDGLAQAILSSLGLGPSV